MLADELFDFGEGEHYWILPLDPYRFFTGTHLIFPLTESKERIK
jgi:hypothetical protein